eukprot:scaffold55249_cov49-Phaeocystis_antarctica.AAC.6
MGPIARAEGTNVRGGHGERPRRRKQPQQAPSAHGKQVMRSPPGWPTCCTRGLGLGSIQYSDPAASKARRATTTSLVTCRHWALGIGHWAWGMGHWARDIGQGALGIGQNKGRIGQCALSIGHWAVGIGHWALGGEVGWSPAA